MKVIFLEEFFQLLRLYNASLHCEAAKLAAIKSQVLDDHLMSKYFLMAQVSRP